MKYNLIINLYKSLSRDTIHPSYADIQYTLVTWLSLFNGEVLNNGIRVVQQA